MRKLFFILTFLFLGNILHAQSSKIETKKVVGSNIYSQNGKYLSMSQLENLMAQNKAALASLKKAKSNNTWSTIFGVAGGALIGYPIGQAIGSGEPQWELAGIGAGLILVAIPFNSAYNKHSKKAVDLYNNSLSSTAGFRPNFEFNMSGNGIGITMSF